MWAKQVCDAFSIPCPAYASMSDLVSAIGNFAGLTQTTFNEIIRQIWLSETVTPVASDVWNDVGLRYFTEQL